MILKFYKPSHLLLEYKIFISSSSICCNFSLFDLIKVATINSCNRVISANANNFQLLDQNEIVFEKLKTNMDFARMYLFVKYLLSNCLV